MRVPDHNHQIKMSFESTNLPGSSVEIVPATWRDLTELRHLEQVCFRQDAWPLLDVIAVLSFPGIIRHKAAVDGKMVGFIAGEIRNPPELAWIATFGVLPAFRRHGIGSALLSACEDALGVQRVRLSVRRGNENAIRLYKNFGYQQIGTWPEYYRGGIDAVVLEKHFYR